MILGRAPDASGHDHWVEQVQRLGDVSLASFLAASDEQYRRVAAQEPPPVQARGTGTPVTGTVKSASTYVLYCRYRDDKVVIRPDAAPAWEVTVLHITGVQVRPGDRVVAGITPIAPRATPLPFRSQVDAHGGTPAWPHVHVEVLDPRVPDRPSGGC